MKKPSHDWDNYILKLQWCMEFLSDKEKLAQANLTPQQVEKEGLKTLEQMKNLWLTLCER